MIQEKNPKSTVACFGEILWDNTPSGLYLGGAPYNVAYHLQRLNRPAMLISSVGNDELGMLALQRAKEAGIDTSCIHVSPLSATGISDIEIQKNGDAFYSIRSPSAWDRIESTRLLEEKLARCAAFVYGTLSSRSPVTADTLETLLESSQALKVCDLNLRPPHDDMERAVELAGKADVLKLNEEELYRLSNTPPTGPAGIHEAISQVKALTGVDMIFATRGSKPTVYFDGERLLFMPPPKREKLGGDTIGAGDAFTAAVIDGLLQEIAIEASIDRANRIGSYVASKPSAQPRYNPTEILEPAYQ